MKQTELRRTGWIKRGTKGLSRGTSSLRRTTMPQKNVERIAKKRATYAKHLRSVEWLKLRYARFLLDQGMCQCEWCLAVRRELTESGMVPAHLPEGVYAGEALNPIPVHYTASGTTPWRRIRGFSTHHVRYRELGKEQLRDLRTMYKHHHEATEAKYSTRRRYLGIPTPENTP